MTVVVAVIKRILKKKHNLNGHDLTVEVYYPDIGVTRVIPSLGENPPSPFSLSLDHPGIFTFINKCPHPVAWRQEQETSLRYQLELSKDHKLNVKYISNGQDPRSDVQWRDAATGEIVDFLKTIRVYRLVLTDDVLEPMEKECDNYRSKSVIVQVEKDTKTLVIIGYSEDAKTTKSKLKKVMSELESSNAMTENDVPLSPWQLGLLDVSNFMSYMEERTPGLTISANQSGIKLKGKPKQLQRGFSLLFDDFQSNIVCRDFPMMDSVFGGLKEPSILAVVEDKIRAEKLQVAVEVDGSRDTVTLHGFADPDIDECKDLINQALTHRRVNIPGNAQTVLSSARWKQVRDGLLSKHSGSVVLSEDPDKGTLDVICVTTVIAEVDTAIKSLRDLTTEERIIPMTVAAVYLLQSHHTDSIQTIQDHVNSAFSDTTTLVTPCDPSEISGYLVKGSKESADLAASEIQRLLASVVRDDILIKMPTMPLFFLSVPGKCFLRQIGDSHQSVCVIDDDMECLLDR